MTHSAPLAAVVDPPPAPATARPPPAHPPLPPQLADVKAKIQETQGDDFPAASMNIIYQGKVGRPGGSSSCGS